jgi:hypothetical protein
MRRSGHARFRRLYTLELLDRHHRDDWASLLRHSNPPGAGVGRAPNVLRRDASGKRLVSPPGSPRGASLIHRMNAVGGYSRLKV